MPQKKTALKLYHRFLDESGDTTFYGKKKRIIVGNEVFPNHLSLEW